MRRQLFVAVAALLALATAACQPPNTTPPGGAPLRYRDLVFAKTTKATDLVYGSAKDQAGTTVSLKLDLYQPVGDTRSKRPVIVWIHGGAFVNGNKSSAEIVDEATTFARKGYVTVSIDYRLTGGCFPVTSLCPVAIADAKHDAQAAVRWLRSKAATYKLDTTRIAIGGSSAGAITALNVAYGPDDVGTSGTPGQPSDVRAAVSLSGGVLGSVPSAGEPPALLFHDPADSIVPYRWATRTVDEAHAAGLEAFLTDVGGGHVPYSRNRDTILTQTTNFLWWELDLAHAPR